MLHNTICAMSIYSLFYLPSHHNRGFRHRKPSLFRALQNLIPRQNHPDNPWPKTFILKHEFFLKFKDEEKASCRFGCGVTVSNKKQMSCVGDAD